MKKIIFFSLLILRFLCVSQKLNTDKKDHLKELQGTWGDLDAEISIKIFLKNNIAYFQENDEKPLEFKKYNDYIYYTESNIKGLGKVKNCFSYDIKIKRLVNVPKCEINEWDDSLPRL